MVSAPLPLQLHLWWVSSLFLLLFFGRGLQSGQHSSTRGFRDTAPCSHSPVVQCVKNLHRQNPQPCMFYQHWSCTSHDDKLLKDSSRKKQIKDRYIKWTKKNKRVLSLLLHMVGVLSSCCLRVSVSVCLLKGLKDEILCIIVLMLSGCITARHFHVR